MSWLRDKEAAVTRIEENLHRKDATPMDYAHGIEELITKLGASQQEVARMLLLVFATVQSHLVSTRMTHNTPPAFLRPLNTGRLNSYSAILCHSR